MKPWAKMSAEEKATAIRYVARLARIAMNDDEVAALIGEFDSIVAMMDQLAEADVSGVEPMTSVNPMEMKMRADVVNEEEWRQKLLKNAPQHERGFFVVPKVIE